MGLDMYLFAKRFMWYNEDNLKQEVASAFPELPEGVLPKEVQFEVGYWRKANAVHKWFVDNVQEDNDDCGYYYVSKNKLKELKSLCEQVLKDNEKASELLPTQSGFFFGNTDYGMMYEEDLENTIQIIDRALAMPAGYELEYHSSW